MSRVIYPARRAVEHAVGLSGVEPIRLFAVLWPLWQVEITAASYDEQAYEIIDRYLVRAIVEGGVDTPGDLAALFGLPPSLVQRCLDFLAAIDHVRLQAGRVEMTPLGLRSAQMGVRLVAKESRQKLLVERHTGRPLPRRFYQGSVTVLATAETPSNAPPFRPLFSPAAFNPRIVSDLAERADRVEYNLPGRLRDIKSGDCQDVWLPVYVIETTDRTLLAYSAVSDERDDFLETVCREVPAVHARIAATSQTDPQKLWTEWLADCGYGRGILRKLSSGRWRATFPAASFSGPPKLALSAVGSFQLRDNLFLQLWCDDRELRSRAVQERALGICRSPDVRSWSDLLHRMAGVAGQLEVDAPRKDDLRSYARARGRQDAFSHLE